MRFHIQKLDPRLELWRLTNTDPHTFPFLMESLGGNSNQARFSILGAYPSDRMILQSDGTLDYPQAFDGVPKAKLDNIGNSFLNAFDLWWQHARRPQLQEGINSTLPFAGGWFVFAGYELLHQIEPTVPIAPAHSNIPIACAYRIGIVILHDHQTSEKWLIMEPDYRHYYDELMKLIAFVSTRASSDANLSTDSKNVIAQENKNKCEMPLKLVEEAPEIYLDNIARIKKYIYEGDVFQVNISRLWQGKTQSNVHATQIYENLRNTNPGPFCAFAQFEQGAIVSSSPERLFELRDRLIQTRPIAGTFPRHLDKVEDEALSKALVKHPKERAEHIMLIDMERNDLGRICEGGSVEVNELMVTESYAHVHHIVSNVRGKVNPGSSPGDIMAAMFPGGTITGCPKVRCMQIINELENRRRGPYTGSLGYVGHDGNADFNILIRTIMFDNGLVELKAGGGIVIDSDPQRELSETRHKARGPAQALHGLLA